MSLKENSKIKDKFFQANSHPEIRKTYFFGSKMGGVDLYTGSTYTQANRVKYQKVSSIKKKTYKLKCDKKMQNEKIMTSINKRVLWQYTRAVLAL